MPKYYVTVSPNEKVIIADDHRTALKMCISRLIELAETDFVEVATLASVGEQGFGFHENDLLFLTEPILDELGVKHNLKGMEKLEALDNDYKRLGGDCPDFGVDQDRGVA